jgi:hypothetical protein
VADHGEGGVVSEQHHDLREREHEDEVEEELSWRDAMLLFDCCHGSSVATRGGWTVAWSVRTPGKPIDTGKSRTGHASGRNT